MPDLLFSPHNDDATLFAGFIVRNRRPLVVTVYDSYIQPARGAADCDHLTRRMEDIRAMKLLNPGSPPQFLGFDDRLEDLAGVVRALTALAGPLRLPQPAGHLPAVTNVWIPAVEPTGNRHHNLVGTAARLVFGAIPNVRVLEYLTYTENGRSTSPHTVPFAYHDIGVKLQALACYETQLRHADCWEHFTRGLLEYCTTADAAAWANS